MKVITHEDYLVAVTTAVCEQYPATGAALSEVQLVFGTGPRRRGLTRLYRVWSGGEADEPLPLVEIAAIGGLSPAETCHVVLHELAHVLAPGTGHGKEWRYAARQVGLMNPRAWPGADQLADWGTISPAIRPKLLAIPMPTERALVDYYYDWYRRGCGAGYGTRVGHQPWRGGGQPLPEGGLPASRLWIPSKGHAEVAGGRCAAVSNCRPRQYGAGGKHQKPS